MATVYYVSRAAMDAAVPLSVQRYLTLDEMGTVASIGLFTNGLLQLYVAAKGENIDPATIVGAVTVASIRE